MAQKLGLSELDEEDLAFVLRSVPANTSMPDSARLTSPHREGVNPWVRTFFG